MNDYKYSIQIRAEEIAEMDYGIDYYDLPRGLQYEVYCRAEDGCLDDMTAYDEGRLEA